MQALRELSVDTVTDIDALLWHFARPLPPDRRDESAPQLWSARS
jgi:hypothetical protein